ncbi:MAG: hypothetical protein AB7V16_13235, partial [Vulcanibacillus sp.]
LIMFDSTFIIAAIAMTLMIFGFVSNKRIFNLLCVGPLIALAIDYSSSVAMVVTIVGLMIFNLYWAFIARYE